MTNSQVCHFEIIQPEGTICPAVIAAEKHSEVKNYKLGYRSSPCVEYHDICQDQLGNQFSLEKLDIQTIVKMEEGHYAIPASMKFLRLPQEFTTLKEDGATFNKTATADLTVLTKHADDLYSLRGYLTHEIPHEELAKGDVEFMLYTAGFDGSDLVKKADKEKIVKIADGTPLSRRMEKMKKRLGKTASSHSSFLALKKEVDVVKLASAFSDEETIDKIL